MARHFSWRSENFGRTGSSPLRPVALRLESTQRLSTPKIDYYEPNTNRSPRRSERPDRDSPLTIMLPISDTLCGRIAQTDAVRSSNLSLRATVQFEHRTAVMEGRIIRTLREGSVWAGVIELDDSPYAFRLWRWLGKGAQTKSTCTFRRGNLESLSAVLETLPSELESPTSTRAARTPITGEPRVIDDERPLYREIFGEDVVLTVHEGKRWRWFMMRRIVAAEPLTIANWFFAEHIEKLENAARQAARWIEDR